MDKCISFKQIDEHVNSTGAGLHSRNDMRATIATLMNDSNSEKEAYDAFYELYLFVITDKGEMNWLYEPISSAVDRYGFVFSRTNYTYNDSLSTSDHVLLLVSRILFKSLSVRGMQVLSLLFDEHILDPTNGKVLALCSRSLGSLFVTDEQDRKVVELFTTWLCKVSSLPQWNPSIVSTLVSHWSDEELSKTYWLTLEFIVSSFEESFVTYFFLPLLETKPSKAMIKQIIGNCPLISYDLILIMLRLFSPMNRELLSLCVDCINSLINVSSIEVDWNSLIKMMIQYLIEDNLSLQHRQKCVSCLSSMVTNHLKEIQEIQLVPLLVTLFQSHNDRLILKAFEMIPFLHLALDQLEIIRVSVCIVYRSLLQREFESLSNGSSIRMKCFNTLKDLNTDYETLVRWVLIPLQSYASVIPAQDDIIDLIEYTLRDSLEIELYFRANELNWNKVACFGIQLGLSESQKLIIRRNVEKKMEDPALSEDTLYTMLCVCECVGLQPSLSLLDRIISFPSSSLTEDLVNQFCIVIDRRIPTLQDYLIPILNRSSHSILSLSLSPSLQLLESLPFSYLQESLVSLSMNINDDRKVLQLLRLLRIINGKTYQLNKKAAQQIHQENDLDEEIRESTTQSSHENMLNNSYACSGILSCYMPLLIEVVRSECSRNSSTQLEILREMVLLSFQILSHTTDHPDLCSLRQFMLSVLALDDDDVLVSVTPLCVASFVEQSWDDEEVLGKFTRCVDTLCSKELLIPLQQIISLLFYSIATNKIRDCFLRPILITYCRIPALRELIENGMKHLMCSTSKGDLNDYLLEIVVDWLNCGFISESLMSPVRLLMQVTKGLKEAKVINTLIAFFVKHPSLELLELLTQYKNVWSEPSRSLLEKYVRGEHQFVTEVANCLNNLKRTRKEHNVSIIF